MRLVRLHLVSRRVPSALAVLVTCAALLQASLRWHWGAQGGAGVAALPSLVLEGVAGAIVVATTGSPFGESERTGGRWLPYLRLGTVVALAASAIALMCGGAAGGVLIGGSSVVLRDVAGFAGVGLLCAAVLGGSLAWVGPMAYLAVSEYALAENWYTPWVWPARPPHDLGAGLCAAAVFAAGVLAITVRGSRDTEHELT